MIVSTDVGLAAESLAAGKLVAFATETVYGLGADASNPVSVGRIFSVKGRPLGHPLIVHVSSAATALDWCAPTEHQAEMFAVLAESFWPGPLTIILPRSDLAAEQTVGGLDTIGLRVPAHPMALELLDRFGGGVAAPSANKFGKVSPTSACHVVDDLGSEIDLVLDGGDCQVGLESTIISLVNDRPLLLRAGGVTRQHLSRCLNQPLLSPSDSTSASVRAPGMLRSHYAPNAEVEIVNAENLDARLEQASQQTATKVAVVAPFEVAHSPAWVMPSDSTGYAQRLYGVLREADNENVHQILVIPPAEGDLVEAVGDRLGKAAAASSDGET